MRLIVALISELEKAATTQCLHISEARFFFFWLITNEEGAGNDAVASFIVKCYVRSDGNESFDLLILSCSYLQQLLAHRI